MGAVKAKSVSIYSETLINSEWKSWSIYASISMFIFLFYYWN